MKKTKLERSEVALEALRILLPEVNKQPLLTVNKKTYDSAVKDSFYIADVFLKESGDK